MTVIHAFQLRAVTLDARRLQRSAVGEHLRVARLALVLDLIVPRGGRTGQVKGAGFPRQLIRQERNHIQNKQTYERRARPSQAKRLQPAQNNLRSSRPSARGSSRAPKMARTPSRAARGLRAANARRVSPASSSAATRKLPKRLP